MSSAHKTRALLPYTTSLLGFLGGSCLLKRRQKTVLFEILPHNPVSVANTGQDLQDLRRICALQGGKMRLGKMWVLCQKCSFKWWL